MIVAGAPLSVVERPTMPRSPPNRCCHMPWLMTTTLFLPGTSSSAVNARPITGCTRAISKKSQDTSALLMRSAPLLPAKLAEPLCAATICSNDVLCTRQSKKVAGATEKRPYCGTTSLTRTSASGSGNGSGRSSTPLITLNIALVAPMPSARVRMATTANAGLLVSWRTP